jgi:RNA polymerase sigma-B factor
VGYGCLGADWFGDPCAGSTLLAQLPLRRRQVVAYRFFGNMTQVPIGEMVGVSQMQVSRLLLRAVGRLRAGLLADDPPTVPG